ncbi:MAG: ABC transporter ATP-binding protein [Cyclobacteriaceae bacterium]|nr:ABC transporter ATP-binding protein [Cyclobacteriaceae bacterium]
MNALETTGLTHHFGKDCVLDNIGLQVPAGSIYGFLGPNGAGKTTTLKLTLGLLRKQQGSISILGKSLESNRLEILRKVGSLIESPSVYTHLTARENLRILQNIYRCPISRIDEVLALVGLSNTGSKLAGQFSLGMKQRLSIAMALLHSPELLILDEPTNGLDPNGIIEMRELLKKLSREDGITVVVSSHLLAEIEKLVTDVGIIHLGKMMFQGTFDELRERQHRSTVVVLGTTDPDATHRYLIECNLDAQRENGSVLLPAISREQLTELTRQLVARNIGVYEISTRKNDLESIFLEVVNP